MKPLVLLPYYIHWHYGQGVKNIFAITRNLVWFFWHFFSIGLLSKTLFMPWQKLHEERPHGMDLGPIFSTLIINGLMRMAGALIRLFIILIGLVTIAGTLGCAAIFLGIWLLMPLCILALLFLGVVMIVRST